MVAKHWLLLVVLALSTSGCTRRIYFSQSIRDGLQGGGDIEAAESEASLQYFSAHRIVLERNAKSRAESINGGRIFVRRGRLIEQVVVRRGTPGIATEWGEDWIAVSFEEGTSLLFERATSEASGSALYRLRQTESEQGTSEVRFNGLGWTLVSPHYNATLQVKRNAAGKRKKRRRVLGGRRL